MQKTVQKEKTEPFISFEGGEGAGKTTQICKLEELYKSQGRSVLVTREPGGGPHADKIRSLLLSVEMKGMVALAELFLYEASRAQHVAAVIVPALQAKTLVLCDRFSDSSLVYQGIARNLGEELVDRLNTIATDNLKPDLTFIFDLDPLLGLKRLASRSLDRMEQERLQFHQDVRKGYQKLAQEEPLRCHKLDANQSPEKIHEEICVVLRKRKFLL